MENPSATVVQQQFVVYSFVFLFRADKGVIKDFREAILLL